jgi:hypothetical protein
MSRLTEAAAVAALQLRNHRQLTLGRPRAGEILFVRAVTSVISVSRAFADDLARRRDRRQGRADGGR